MIRIVSMSIDDIFELGCTMQEIASYLYYSLNTCIGARSILPMRAHRSAIESELIYRSSSFVIKSRTVIALIIVTLFDDFDEFIYVNNFCNCIQIC